MTELVERKGTVVVSGVVRWKGGVLMARVVRWKGAVIVVGVREVVKEAELTEGIVLIAAVLEVGWSPFARDSIWLAVILVLSESDSPQPFLLLDEATIVVIVVVFVVAVVFVIVVIMLWGFVGIGGVGGAVAVG